MAAATQSSAVVSPAENVERAIVFISYAREDKDFVLRLNEALQLKGVDVRGDWQLVRGESYQEQLRDLQLNADTVIFILSPDSVRSVPCRAELDRAADQKKRILPVVCRDVGQLENELPPALSLPQWTFLRHEDDFITGVQGLVQAINTDFGLMPEHRRLLQAAEIWERNNRSSSYLLRKDGLRRAEDWLTKTGVDANKLPKATALQLEYIRASRSAQTRGSRIAIVLVAAIAVAMAVLAVVALIQRSQAKKEQKIAEDQTAEAQKQRGIAEGQTKIATEQKGIAEQQKVAAEKEATEARKETANRLAVEAVEKLNGSPEKALTLALQAVKTFSSHQDPLVPSAVGALQKVMLGFAGSRPVLPWRDGRQPVAIDPSLRWVASSDRKGAVIFGPVGGNKTQQLSPPAVPFGKGERWANEETLLIFSDNKLVAARPLTNVKDHIIAVLWFWKLTERGLDRTPIILGTFEIPWWSGIRMLVSPDGAWLAHTNGYQAVFVRNLDRPDSMLSIRSNVGGNWHTEFSRDSRMLVIESRGSIQLIALPAGGGKPAELKRLETHIPEVFHLAIYPPLGQLQQEIAKRKLLAALGVNGEVEWWDLSEAIPVRHELPSLFSAFRDSLQVVHLDSDRVSGSLDWSPGGIALLATMAEKTTSEFGVAAFYAIDGKDGWRPLLHRYEGKYGSSTSRSEGSPGAVTGYKVKNAGDLGVKSATWLSDEGALTLGFNGTLFAREVAHLGANQFWLVASQVSFVSVFGSYIVTGGQDGKLRFFDPENIGDEDRPAHPLTLNGHDAPIRDVLGTPPDRILSIDTAGVARIWSLGHPMLTPDNTLGVVGNWKWLLRRPEKSNLELWPLDAPDVPWVPRSQLALGNSKQIATAQDGSWAATLNVEPSNSLPLVIRLWQMEQNASTRTPRVERRYPAIMPDLSISVDLKFAVSGSEARVILSSTDFAKNRSVVWMGDLFKPGKKLRELKNGAVELQLKGATPDLRWALVELKQQGSPQKLSKLVDLRRWDQVEPPFLALEGFEAERISKTSPDGEWLCLDARSGKPLIVDLSSATKGGHSVQWSERTSYREIIFGRQRPPMIIDSDANVQVWNASSKAGTHFQKVVHNPDLTEMAWDDSGEWLALAHRDGRVWLTRPPGVTSDELRRHIQSSIAQTALPLPLEPEARGEIWRLFPFPELGWIVASNDKYNVLIWRRSPDGTWQDPPMVMSNRELYFDGELHDVRFRSDGRMAFFNGQVVNFDPSELMAEGHRLLSGRLPVNNGLKSQATKAPSQSHSSTRP